MTTIRVKKGFEFVKRKPIISFVVSMILIQFLVTTVYAATFNTVNITLDGKEQTASTHAETVAGVLQEQDVIVGENDYLNVSLDSKVTDKMDIEWRPAVKVVVAFSGGTVLEKWTSETTVGDFLKDENINLKSSDTISPERTSEITSDMRIEIGIAFSITVNNGADAFSVDTTKITVADLLTSNNVTLGDLDRVEPALQEQLSDSGTVSIVRVGKSTTNTSESIPFDTVQQEDPTLPVGQTKIVNEGKEGTLQVTVESVSENGVVVSNTEVASQIVQEPVNSVVAVGTLKPTPVVTSPLVTKAQTVKTPAANTPAASAPTTAVAPPSSSGGVVGYAKQFIGVPYRYGGTSPSGFDCSGFVTYCFQNYNGTSLPRTSGGMAQVGVGVSDPQPGDLVVFRTGSRISHAGIYIGGGQFISSTTSRGVRIDSMYDGYWGSKYAGARRL